VLLYLGDYLSVRFRIPNRETLTDVQIEVYYAVGLKGQKTEFMRADPETETCVHSLFPQSGYRPCWYVMRHTTKWIDARLKHTGTDIAGVNCGDEKPGLARPMPIKPTQARMPVPQRIEGV
jgi:hypothetical protein